MPCHPLSVQTRDIGTAHHPQRDPSFAIYYPIKQELNQKS